MCEGGLGETKRFRRAVAHHVYIDQAIRARAGDGTPAAFDAHDVGTTPIAPGDLLCSARRPRYRSIAERRRQLGNGARTPLRHRREAGSGPRVHPRHRGHCAGYGGPEAVAGGERAGQGLPPCRRDASPVRPPEAARRADRGGCVRCSPTIRVVRCADGFRVKARLARRARVARRSPPHPVLTVPGRRVSPLHRLSIPERGIEREAEEARALAARARLFRQLPQELHRQAQHAPQQHLPGNAVAGRAVVR